MIRFVLGLCGYVPAPQLEAMREVKDNWFMTWNKTNCVVVVQKRRIATLESELAALRAQLPNRDKAGKFTRRI